MQQLSRTPIKLREGELVALIKAAADSRKYVSLRFGPGWASVDWWECEWTLPVLAEMRGVPAGKDLPFFD